VTNSRTELEEKNMKKAVVFFCGKPEQMIGYVDYELLWSLKEITDQRSLWPYSKGRWANIVFDLGELVSELVLGYCEHRTEKFVENWNSFLSLSLSLSPKLLPDALLALEIGSKTYFLSLLLIAFWPSLLSALYSMIDFDFALEFVTNMNALFVLLLESEARSLKSFL